MGAYFIAAAVFSFAPLGAFVLRKHIRSAAGPWKLAGRLLQAAAVLSSVPAFLLFASVVLGILS
jgi:hypothetical protein